MIEKKPSTAKRKAAKNVGQKRKSSASIDADFIKLINSISIQEVRLCSCNFSNFGKIYHKKEGETKFLYSGKMNTIRFGDGYVVGFCDYSATESLKAPQENEQRDIFDINCSYIFVVSDLPALNKRLRRKILEFIGKRVVWPYFVGYLKVINGVVDSDLPRLPNVPKEMKIEE